MKMYQKKSSIKTKRNYWLALPVIVLCLLVSAYGKQNVQAARSVEMKENLVKNPASKSDSVAYVETDIFASPQEREDFYKEIFKMVQLPKDLKMPDAKDLHGDLVVEMEINQAGNIAKMSIVKGIETSHFDPKKELVWLIKQQPFDELNDALLKALMTYSAQKDWKVNIKSSNANGNKIYFKIPLNVVVENLLMC